MENERKKEYVPWQMELVEYPKEDVIRTSYVEDNYGGGWDDDDARPTGTNGF